MHFPRRAFIPLETRHRRRLTVARGNLSLTGFTLVELLIAVAIFSVVSIAIYATFSSGAAVLRRVKDTDLTQQRILLKTERFSRELREQPACRKRLFQGDKTRISFCANIDYFPYRLTYFFDSSANAFKRVADKLDEIIDEENNLNPEFHSPAVIFLPEVKEVKFSYLYLDLNKNAYLWTDQWEQDYLPFAVKFIIFTEKQKYESTVYLPRA
ncbi:MAG: prepilin-type N-terminal cleavage/methylation domain-containing protein [Candidatus Omnitrophica bacterium]|nr:prepilin-type N-terminal cleavage/methylation domain-containing protein [Candidatus Omnitrophota bacterium]